MIRVAGMNYVCLYTSYLESLGQYSDEEIGRLVRAMLAYAAKGETTQFDGVERYIWPMLRAQMDRDKAAYQERCERNRANGAKGGRPRKNQTVSGETEGFAGEPEKAKEKEKEKEKENNSSMADKPPIRTSKRKENQDGKSQFQLSGDFGTVL